MDINLTGYRWTIEQDRFKIWFGQDLIIDSSLRWVVYCLVNRMMGGPWV